MELYCNLLILTNEFLRNCNTRFFYNYFAPFDKGEGDISKSVTSLRIYFCTIANLKYKYQTWRIFSIFVLFNSLFLETQRMHQSITIYTSEFIYSAVKRIWEIANFFVTWPFSFYSKGSSWRKQGLKRTLYKNWRPLKRLLHIKIRDLKTNPKIINYNAIFHISFWRKWVY